MKNDKPCLYFITINSFSVTPVAHFIINYLSKIYTVYLLECFIKGISSFNKEVECKYIWKFSSSELFNNQRSWLKLYKYIIVVKHLFFLGIQRKKNKIIYTSDYQVLFFVLHLYKILKQKRTSIVYHQFELIDISELKGINLYMFKYCLKNGHLINLCIFPEENRAKYFSNISQSINNIFIFPNTCLPIEQLKISFSLKYSKPFIVGHIGNFGMNHYTKELFQAIDELSDIPITFMFIGRKSEEIKKELRKIKNPNFISIDEVPHSELPNYYQKIDVGLILYKGISLNFEYCAPNKLYEYWSNGIPVIAHKLQGLIPIFTEEYLGRLIDFNNINEIKQIILYYLENQKTLKGNRETAIAFFNEKLSVNNHLSHLQEQIETL